MSPIDYLLLGGIAVALFFAFRSAWRRRKSGCCGDCSGCSSCFGCSSCRKDGCEKRDPKKQK